MIDLAFEKAARRELFTFDDFVAGHAYCVTETELVCKLGRRICTGCGKSHRPRLLARIPLGAA